MNMINTRCRGCAYISQHGAASLNGQDVGVLILREKCPACGGRMQSLYIQRLQRTQGQGSQG
jgi:uncharacterized protein YbbK (DUF523 family)